MPRHGDAVTYPGRYGGNQLYKSFVVSSPAGYRGIDAGFLAMGNGLCVDGLVLGRVTRGARTATPAAKAGGNTGNGVLTMDGTTPIPGGLNAPDGEYRVRFTAAASNGGTYEVFGPNGASLGVAAVGATFNNLLKFAIADGATDFIVGDEFVITLATAQGSLKYVPWDPAGVDGSEVFAGILIGEHDTDGADVRVAVVAREHEVQRAALTFDGTPTDNQKAVAYAQMAAEQIILR